MGTDLISCTYPVTLLFAAIQTEAHTNMTGLTVANRFSETSETCEFLTPSRTGEYMRTDIESWTSERNGEIF